VARPAVRSISRGCMHSSAQNHGSGAVSRPHQAVGHPILSPAYLGEQGHRRNAVAYDVLTARQPGARFAPLDFLSGALFSQDIHTVYEAVSQPVWMSHGVRGDFKDFRKKALVHDRGNWQTTAFETGALPYFEQSAEFCRELDAFSRAGTAARQTKSRAGSGKGTAKCCRASPRPAAEKRI